MIKIWSINILHSIQIDKIKECKNSGDNTPLDAKGLEDLGYYVRERICLTQYVYGYDYISFFKHFISIL